MAIQQLSSHDRLFKQAMSHPAIACDLFNAVIAPDVKAVMALETLTVEPNSFVGRHQNHYTDLLYSVKLKDGHPAFCYILAELKSQPDRFLPLQLWRYTCEVLEHWRKQQVKAQKSMAHLPLIYPLCIYNGKTTYSYSTDFRDCFFHRELAGKIFDQPFQLIDLGQLSDDEIRQHGLAAGFELLSKHIWERDNFLFLQDFCKNELKTLLEKLDGSYLFDVIQYLLRAGEFNDKNRFFNVLTNSLSDKSEEIMTIAEQLQQETKQEIAYNMLSEGYAIKDIHRLTKLPIKEIKKIQQTGKPV